jgi:hypothetical protein
MVGFDNANSSPKVSLTGSSLDKATQHITMREELGIRKPKYCRHIYTIASLSSSILHDLRNFKGSIMYEKCVYR